MDLGKLNPPQREAVTHGGGPMLVLAGAGSGKTRVITHRIAHLLRGGLPARAIAALTFTNKAAAEMRERVGALVGGRGAVADLTIGTFHALGLSILKAERTALGFPRGFVIYDTADQLGCVREILRRIDTGGRRFDIKAILTRISLAKNGFVGPDDYALAAGDDEYDAITAEVYPRYQESLRAYAAVDFDDLITEVVRLWRDHDEVRDRWRRRFRHVLVDEFQDTNRAQLLMVEELVAEHSNLCVVGDDDQSIYAWRGAEPGNILSFEQRFPGARVIKLEQNYRSTPTILAAANAVIANNRDRYGKTLWTSNPDQAVITCAVAADVAGEARFVAREIDTLRAGGRRWSDFAVLYRSNLQSRELEEELRAHRIPYVMYGGQQFYERKEVKDVLAYLRLALNPRDEIALRRVINYPARGIGAATIEWLAGRAQASHRPMWNVLVDTVDHPERGGGEGKAELRGAARTALTGFATLVRGLSADLRGGGVAAAARHLLDAIDLHGDIRAGSPGVTAAQRRIDNVEDLIRSLDRHQQAHPGPSALLDYLRQLSLQSSDDDATEDSRDKVVLTTLHGAKGLEFPVVFFVGLEEEIIPHARTLMPHASDLLPGEGDHVSDVSEERRLAYVGITRARHKLYLTRTSLRARHGKNAPRTPSRFLLEIPPELIEIRDLASEASEQVASDEVQSFFASFDLD